MRKIILSVFSCIIINSLTAQTDTSFWFAAPDVSSVFDYDKPVLFRISSYQQPALVTISVPANPSFPTQTINIPSFTTQSVDLTNWLNLIECGPGDVVQNKGIKITSNNKIAVYYEVDANGPNPEIFALKGRNALGNQFYISSQYILNNTASHTPTPLSSFNIVASENNTNVTIRPTANISGHLANIPFTISLNRGQTYAAIASSTLASAHLQGSFVSSDKPIAITLADDLLQGIAFGGICEDLAGDQTVPVNIIGNEYIAFRSNLNNPDKLYITAVQNGTIVKQDGLTVSTINTGQSLQLEVVNTTSYIQLSNPAYAYHLAGVGCEVGSAVLPKITCTGSSSVSITRSTVEEFIVTLLIRSGGQNGFRINNSTSAIPGTLFTAVPFTNGAWYWAKIYLSLSDYPNGSVIKFDNNLNVFQLGVLQGGPGSGVGYGYFSDYNTLQANATTSTPSVCVGSPIRLSGDTISSATYTWTGPNNFSSNQQNILINNASLTNAGNYVLNVSVPNCGTYADTINISVKSKTFSNLNPIICQGTSFAGYSSSGVYIDTLVGSNGCDSIRTINLTVLPTSTSTLSNVICQGETFLGYSTTGIHIDTLVSTNGCDSIRILNLIVKPRSTSLISASICQGETYFGYSVSGVYLDTLVAANGCDSIRTLNLTVKPKYFQSLSVSICQGESYMGYTVSGIYIDTVSASNGCDSIITTQLLVKPRSFRSVNQVICQGTSFEGYSITGTYIDTLLANNGCDSIRTLNLTVSPRPVVSINAIICQGETFLGYTTSGVYIDTLVVPGGCDSIRTLLLEVTPSIVAIENKIICRGQSYLGYNMPGTYRDTTISSVGCDSISIINLAVADYPNPKLVSEKELCVGQIFLLNPGNFPYSNYAWSDSSTSQTITVSQAGNYSVKVSNICGVQTAFTTIKVAPCNVSVPTVFTPNGDGVNDKFRLLNLYNPLDFRLEIFNRWGELIFQTGDVRNAWDGKIKNLHADLGSYVWHCIFSQDGKQHRMKGTILLLR